jgi:LCCL domain
LGFLGALVFGRHPRTLLTAALVVGAQAAFAQNTLGLGAGEGANAFIRDPGKRLTFVCPGTDGASATVFGTDTYTADSGVGAAAIHAGVLKRGVPGIVTIVMGSGANSFLGSKRNDVTTRDYQAWPYSYTFVTDTALSTISWTTVWNQVPMEFTGPISVVCPPGGTTERSIYGTDVYITDSAICVAAVHAGVITLEGGGAVTARRADPLSAYPGGERHNVTSLSWSNWPDAFTVSAATATAAGDGRESAGGGISRRIALDEGFEGTGIAKTNAPPAASISRTIRVDGFEGSGSARERPPPVVISRRITTPGWAGTGSARPRR